LEVSLLTGRTIDQGCGKESGKFSESYMESVAICEMNAEDMKKLGIRDNAKVKVTTQFGSVVIKAKKSRRLKTLGTIFIPYGPWANQILASNTNSTGMPLLKGIKATVEPTETKILNVHELLFITHGKTK
jgi:formylmethanofuran dehydrogenase subunit D